jgi:hypothetical protein
MTYKFALPLIAAASLAACATPEEATLSRSDLAAFTADDVRARGLDYTDVADIPSGAATYEGHVRSDAIVNGEDDYSILGLMEMSVNLTSSATSRVSGTITDINLIDDNDDGFDDQKFDGDLTISGDTESGRIEAQAIGVLDAVLADGISAQSSTWQLDLDGDFVDDFDSADTVVGDVNGGTTGTSSDEYTVLLNGNGAFYGERQ